MGKGSNAQKNKQARDRNQAKDGGGQSQGGGASGIAMRTGSARQEAGLADAAAKRAERDKLRAEKKTKEDAAAKKAEKKGKGAKADGLPTELLAAMAKAKVSKKAKK